MCPTLLRASFPMCRRKVKRNGTQQTFHQERVPVVPPPKSRYFSFINQIFSLIVWIDFKVQHFFFYASGQGICIQIPQGYPSPCWLLPWGSCSLKYCVSICPAIFVCNLCIPHCAEGAHLVLSSSLACIVCRCTFGVKLGGGGVKLFLQHHLPRSQGCCFIIIQQLKL